MMPETFCLFAQKGITLDTSCLLTMYYFSTPRELPTKMDTVEGIRRNGEDQGNHKSQMRGSLSMLHLTVSIKGIPDANAKLNEVEKDVENVNALQICGIMRG